LSNLSRLRGQEEGFSGKLSSAKTPKKGRAAEKAAP
jgi:hypothetical protein